MPLITWSEQLSVNVAQIDGQHQKLIAIINDLTEAIQTGKAKAAIDDTVQGLFDYARTHFETEEKYFQQFDYPEAASHIKEHEEFIQKVREFQTRPAKGQFSLSIQVLQFLGNWLINHILGTDKKYSVFFNDHGLK